VLITASRSLAINVCAGGTLEKPRFAIVPVSVPIDQPPSETARKNDL
jgi:hypothetical protein